MRAQCLSQGPAHVPLGWSRQSRVALRMAIVTPRRPRALASRRCPARRPRVELECAATLRPWNADSASRPPRQCDGMQTLPCGGAVGSSIARGIRARSRYSAARPHRRSRRRPTSEFREPVRRQAAWTHAWTIRRLARAQPLWLPRPSTPSTTSKRARVRREASSLKAVSTQRARVPSRFGDDAETPRLRPTASAPRHVKAQREACAPGSGRTGQGPGASGRAKNHTKRDPFLARPVERNVRGPLGETLGPPLHVERPPGLGQSGRCPACRPIRSAPVLPLKRTP